MVDIKDYRQTQEYVIPLWFNKDNIATVELRCAAVPEIEKQGREELNLSPEKLAEASFEFTDKFVGEIKGLTRDGKPVTTLKDVYENGPLELYSWIKTAVVSSRILSETEIKN